MKSEAPEVVKALTTEYSTLTTPRIISTLDVAIVSETATIEG